MKTTQSAVYRTNLVPRPNPDDIRRDYQDGFGMLDQLPNKKVMVFLGSVRVGPDDPNYKMAVELGKMAAAYGYVAISGGGPGFSEAPLKGNLEGGQSPAAVGMYFPAEPPNPYSKRTTTVMSKNLSVRTDLLLSGPKEEGVAAVVVWPGGLGTNQELGTALASNQNNLTKSYPIVLMGTRCWKRWAKWVRKDLVKSGYVSPKDLNRFRIVDTPGEAIAAINDFDYSTGLFRPKPSKIDRAFRELASRSSEAITDYVPVGAILSGCLFAGIGFAATGSLYGGLGGGLLGLLDSLRRHAFTTLRA